MNHLVEILMLKLIFQVLQQMQILKISHTLILQVLQWKKLANLKTEVDKLEIDKLAPVPVDLSKLSDVVKNIVVKKNFIW